MYYDWRVPQLSMPSLAVDRNRGPFHDRLYAAWPDARDDHRTQIFLSYSSDHGLTWSPPRVVSDDSTGHNLNEHPNHFMPMIAVNRDGIVGITWYDRRDNQDNLGYWARFSASLDGGRTWLPSERVSTSAHVTTDDARKNSGDTAGLTADADGLFHAVWIDNRTGILKCGPPQYECERKRIFVNAYGSFPSTCSVRVGNGISIPSCLNLRKIRLRNSCRTLY